jgi:hypothetical protein
LAEFVKQLIKNLTFIASFLEAKCLNDVVKEKLNKTRINKRIIFTDRMRVDQLVLLVELASMH